jgi:uncharacterized protein (TIGR03084 family)
MTDIDELATDLRDEQAALDDVVSPLSNQQWETPTLSPGWTVADQIGHLSYFDAAAVLACQDADRFRSEAAELRAAPDIDALTLRRGVEAVERLRIWRVNRDRLFAVSSELDETARIPWYGPSMGAKSFITARLMECWAHGQDVCDALAVAHAATDRLRHVAQLGFRTRAWSYVNRGLEVPEVAVRVEVEAPSGAIWTFGPGEAIEEIRGTAVDFCLVVTQRRHIDDTNLVVDGPSAREWMEMAQAFAGGPTTATRRGEDE